MAHRSTPCRRWLKALSLTLAGLVVAACARTTTYATAPRALTVPANAAQTATPRAPTGITIVAIAPVTPSATPTAKPVTTTTAKQVLVQGRVYDSGQGPQHRLSQATLEWQFFAPDWQQYNQKKQ